MTAGAGGRRTAGAGRTTGAERTDRGDLEALVAAREIVVCCGPGGVGKTSTAAAIGTMAALRHGGRVLVVTVDPARRLATALGLSGIGNDATVVPPAALAGTGLTFRGQLEVAMLDTKQSWDDLVRRHAPDRRSAEEILANPLYENVAGRFVQSHDYIAAERLYELHLQGDYDLIVVDTPPSRNAIDFLEAPRRMAEFFSSRLLRWLVAPYRVRLVNLASRPFTQVADRILGSAFLADVTEFFLAFQGMYDGFVERAAAVQALLADPRTTFVTVSTLEPAARREAEVLMSELIARGLPLGALVLNKVLPGYLLDPAPAATAERLRADAAGVAATLLAAGPEGLPPDADERLVAGVLNEVAESYLGYRVVARREAEQRARLGALPSVVVSVPYLDQDVHDLASLVRLGEALFT